MAIEGRITSLYNDKEMSEAIFPRTKTQAVIDDDGVGLNVKLAQLEQAVDQAATEEFVRNQIAAAQLGQDDDITIDLSGFATKDDLADLTANDVDAVPLTRTINDKALNTDINLTAADVNAVPTSRTINNKALSGNISLTATDVNAVPTSRTINSKALSSDISLTATDVGAVPTSRTVNGKALSSDISLTAADVGALASNGISGRSERVIPKWISGSLKAYAESCNEGITPFATQDSTTDLPTPPTGSYADSYKYSTGTIFVRKSTKTWIYIELHPYTAAAAPITYCTATNSDGSFAWSDWRFFYSTQYKPTLSDLGVTATTTELNYVDGVTSAIQTQLNSKQATITGGVSSVVSSNFVANRALISNGDGKAATSAVTSTELGYLDGVTSAIQTQLDGKQASIIGGASSITSSNLTASRALVSNSSGKVASSAVTSTELGYLDGVTSNIQTQFNTINTNAMIFRGTITSEDNLDNITTRGIYYYSSSSAPGNAPYDSNACIVEVLGDPNSTTTRLIQRVSPHSKNAIAIRYKVTDGWGVWKEIALKNLNGDLVADTTKYVTVNAIASGTNLNSIETPGFYAANTNAIAQSLTNSPTSNSFFMTVGDHAGVFQELVEYKLTNPKRYMRNYYYESGWGSWYRIYTTADKPTLSDLGVTATASELNKMDGVTATTAELNYVDGVTSNIQTQLNGKQATITGGVSSVVSSNFVANRALISNGDGKAASSAVTSTELGYLDGVTSAIQTQLNGKQATISGGASTITNDNLTASRALVSDSSGKVAVSAVTSTELGYLDGVTSKIQTQLNARPVATIGTKIANSTDINTLTTPGKYYCANSTAAATMTNGPTTATGFGIIVMDGYIDGRVYQIALLSGNHIRTRYYSGSAWSAWESILSQVLPPSVYGTSFPSNPEEGRLFFKI